MKTSKRMVAAGRRVGVNITCSCGGIDGQHMPKCPRARHLARPLDKRIPLHVATFKQELIACGKSKCGTCGGTKPTHGPYWFAYWQEGKKKRHVYVGKILPAAAAALPRQCFPLAKEITPVRRTPTARARAALKKPAHVPSWSVGYVPSELEAPALSGGFTFKSAGGHSRAFGASARQARAGHIAIRCRTCTATWKHPPRKMAAGTVLALLEHQRSHA